MTRDPETIKKAIITLDQLIKLEQQKMVTQGELRRALLLALVAPGVFEGGKVRTRVEGGLYYSHIFGDVPSRQTMFVITPENGEEVKKPIYEVPIDLWPEKMLAGVKRMRPTDYERIVERERQMWDVVTPD